jgi:putative chitinase
MIITADQLREIVPTIKQQDIDKYLPFLQTELPVYHIDTAQRIGGFIAQVAHESAAFAAVREFASGQEYEGRKDLGNTTLGDGVKFKGRGLIQVTGRGNYNWCSEDLFKDNRLLINPALLEQPQFAVESACWYWTKVKPLNAVCDHPEDWQHVWDHNGKTYTKIMWLSLLINGGENSLEERTAYYERARKVLNF